MSQDLRDQLREAERLLATAEDPDIRTLAEEEIGRLRGEIDKRNPINQRNTVIEIRPGTGGDEAELFARDLFRMYQRYAETQGWKVEIIDSSQSDLGGLKQLVALIKGPNAYRKLRFEGGVHRVQRVPKTEKSGRVHTSAASVVVMPEANEVDVRIRPEDLKIDVFRSGGHGGQSVNTTDSAVRITHLPTNLVVTCQDERSQLKNKEKALSILRSRLWDKQQSEVRKKQGDLRRTMIGSGDRSDKIRTYNFSQNRLTDHRINQSWHNLDSILDGNLEPVIEALQEALLAQVG